MFIGKKTRKRFAGSHRDTYLFDIGYILVLVASHVPVNKGVSAGAVIEQDEGIAPHEEEGDPGAFTFLPPSLAANAFCHLPLCGGGMPATKGLESQGDKGQPSVFRISLPRLPLVT